jgi:putative oxidoreductase
MKVVATIARILLGAMFVFFGANGIFNFLHAPPLPPGTTGQFITAMSASHYSVAVGFFQVVGGLLVLVNRYVPLGLTILAAIIVNILLFHILMAPPTIVPGLVAALLWLIVFWRVRGAFAGIFQARVAD